MAKRLRNDPITMTLLSGSSSIQGTSFGPLALHKAPFDPGANDDRYTITHVPTGHYLRNVRTLAEGEAYIEALLQLDVNWEAPSDDDLTTIHAVCFPRPIKTVGDRPVTLEPLYAAHTARLATQPLRSDSRRLSRLATEWWNTPGDGLLANLLGHVDASLGLEYRELIMARFVTGKHQQLTEEDVPRNAPSVAGYELGPQATAASFRYLMALGDEIDRHCDTDLDTLTDEEFDQWDRTLNGLVISGWQRWSVAVSQLLSCDEQVQARYTRHLGFLGSQRAGWHMLGKKTFLRTPRLEALLPTRRARRAALKEARYE